MNDLDHLALAVEQAKSSVEQGGFPAGAILVKDGKIVARGVSIGAQLHDPTSHGEMATIRASCKELDSASLTGAILYTSMEPCLMCFCAAYWADVTKIVYGCRRTPEMITNGYYQGKTELAAVNTENNREIKLEFRPEYENDVRKIIQDWAVGVD